MFIHIRVILLKCPIEPLFVSFEFLDTCQENLHVNEYYHM